MRDTGRTQRLKWALVVTVNLVLGFFAVIPLWALWFFAANFPLAAMGLTRREPTENDGVFPWLVILVPLVGGFLAAWSLTNLLVWRRTGQAARPYWAASSAVVLLPTIASMVAVSVR